MNKSGDVIPRILLCFFDFSGGISLRFYFISTIFRKEKIMTIPASMPVRAVYTGDGVTVNFPIPFIYFANSDGTKQIKVVLADANGENEVIQMENTNFTITAAGAVNGTLTMLVAPKTGYKLTIIYDIPIEQLTDYKEFGRLPSESIETAFDKITAILKQHQEIIDRCLKVAISGNQTPEELLAEVYGKLDSATEIAAKAISAANTATTAADNATAAVESAEKTLIEVTAYVNSAKDEINETKTSATTAINNTKDTAIAEVNNAVSAAEASVAQTVETAEANIQSAITQATEDVEAAAIAAAKEVLETAEATVTEAAQINVDNYVVNTTQGQIDSYLEKTTKPNIVAYVNNTTKPSIESYVNSTVKTNINNYVSNTIEPKIDAYTAGKLADFNTNAAEKQTFVDASATAAAKSATAAATSESNTYNALAEAEELLGYAEIFGGTPDDSTTDEIVGGVI